ncbi:hypothetical protein RUM44_002612 [Polyplax serrata]|uniref:Uncharacterized protein n=1 Tax=Polyplax serrata TaxID=468196 RepID=A0ABR1AF96_POLSC
MEVCCPKENRKRKKPTRDIQFAQIRVILKGLCFPSVYNDDLRRTSDLQIVHFRLTTRDALPVVLDGFRTEISPPSGSSNFNLKFLSGLNAAPLKGEDSYGIPFLQVPVVDTCDFSNSKIDEIKVSLSSCHHLRNLGILETSDT